MTTIDYHSTIYLISCSHRNLLAIGDHIEWCPGCKDWVVGKEIGDIQIKLENDGEVVVWGGGWITSLGKRENDKSL